MRTDFSVSESLIGGHRWFDHQTFISVKKFRWELFGESEMRKFWNLLRLEESGSIQWDRSKHRQPIKIYKWLIPSNVRYSNKRIKSRLSTENNEFLWRFEIKNFEKISRKFLEKFEMMEKCNFEISRMAKVRFRLTNVHYVWILSIFVSFFYGLIDKAGFLWSISF